MKKIVFARKLYIIMLYSVCEICIDKFIEKISFGAQEYIIETVFILYHLPINNVAFNSKVGNAKEECIRSTENACVFLFSFSF